MGGNLRVDRYNVVKSKCLSVVVVVVIEYTCLFYFFSRTRGTFDHWNNESADNHTRFTNSLPLDPSHHTVATNLSSSLLSKCQRRCPSMAGI